MTQHWPKWPNRAWSLSEGSSYEPEGPSGATSQKSTPCTGAQSRGRGPTQKTDNTDMGCTSPHPIWMGLLVWPGDPNTQYVSGGHVSGMRTMDIEILGSLHAPSAVIKAPISAAALGSSFLVLISFTFFARCIVSTKQYVVLILHGDSICSWFSFLSSHHRQTSWPSQFHLPSLSWTSANHAGKHS